MPEPGPWLSPSEAAQLLRISLSSMRQRIRRGDIKAYRLRLSRLLRLRLVDVEGLLEPTSGDREHPGGR